MLLSDKYWDYIDTPARAEFLEGSTASGKTTTVAVKFIMNVVESDMKLHVIAGNTTGVIEKNIINADMGCLLYTSPSPRDGLLSRMPSSA